MKKQSGRNKIGKLISITGTGMILFVIILCSLLVFPGIAGFHMYHVLSGSMEPAMPVGSLIYVREGKPEDAVDGDIIAFYGSLEDSGIITHRVVENNIVSGIFHTKGDANAEEDPMPVSYDNYIGRVEKIIPRLGAVLTAMTSVHGKAAAAGFVGLGLILNLIGSRIGKEKQSDG